MVTISKLTHNLKKARLINNMTQAEVADKIHVSRKTISSWENGRNIPNNNIIKKLSKIYDVPLTINNNIRNKSKHIRINNIYKYNYIICIISFYLNILFFILNLYNLFTGNLKIFSYFDTFIICIFTINYFNFKGKTFKKKCISILLIFFFTIFVTEVNKIYDMGLLNGTFLNDIGYYIGSFVHSFILTYSFSIIFTFNNI